MYSNEINRLNDLERRMRRQETKPSGPSLGEVYGMWLGLPSLRAFWPMSSYDELGTAVDISGQGRHVYYNGNPQYKLHEESVPYIEFDGTLDCLIRPVEAGLNTVGTESLIGSSLQGITVGGWFWVDAVTGSSQGFITRQDSATIAGSSFDLYMSDTAGGGDIVFNAYSGAATVGQGRTVTPPTTGAWHFCVGRWDRTAQRAYLHVDGLMNTDGTTITTINASSNNLTIGGYNTGVFLLDGRASLAFYCAASLPENLINRLFQASRVLFGA